MAGASLEKRVAQLEQHVAKLQNESERPGWQRTVETYADDQDLLAVFSEAMKSREAERTRARNEKAKTRKS